MNDVKYCWPGSFVLMNKLGIKDEERLFRAEKQLTMLRLLELQARPVEGNFDLKHLCSIHRYIFQDLYDWAGEIRTVDIAKGNMFCKAEFIESNAKTLFSRLKEEHLDTLAASELVRKLAYYFSEINALHPFREGNGRTQREFIKALARSEGFDVDFTKVTADEMLAASKASFLCDYSLMEQVFEKCAARTS